MASNVVSDNFETGSGGVPQLGGADRQTQWCKAWVNFNGTGTVAIRDSYNVSSITDVETGGWRANFTNSMADTNYAASVTGGNNSTHNAADTTVANVTTSYVEIAHFENNARTDITSLYCLVFGD